MFARKRGVRIGLAVSALTMLATGPAAVLGEAPAAEEELILDTVYYDFVDENGTLRGSVLTLEAPSMEVLRSLSSPRSVVVRLVRDNGPPENRIDLVTVGDGYQAGEMSTYQSHVSASLGTMFSQEPFQTYENFFNMHVVEVESADSGVDHDPDYGIYRDTAMDMGFWCGGIERLLCVSVSKAYSYASAAPDVDMVLAVANSTKYGGAGYTSSNLATVSGGSGSAAEISVHEFGHSLGDLADEYWYAGYGAYTGPEPSEPNVSTLNEKAMGAAGTKWAAWLGVNDSDFDGLISTYEGAYYYEEDIYRPTNNSKMRSLSRPFNLPSVEALIIEIYKIVSPIDDATPEEEVLSGMDVASVVLLEPVGYALDLEWRLDGDIVPGAEGTTLDIATLGLDSGEYTLSVIVTDNTEWVRDEAARATWMIDNRSWTVLISAFGDYNQDGDVDLADYAVFADCMAGPDTAPSPTVPDVTGEGCLNAFDNNGDGDVDLDDFAPFQVALGNSR